MIRIGIDPDSKFIGCSILEDNRLSINKYTITEFLYNKIPEWSDKYKKFCFEKQFGEMKIFLEGGWLNNHYYQSTESPMIINNIARKIGMNHEVGLIIEESLKFHELKFETVKPVQYSRFKPEKDKINHIQFTKMLNEFGIEYKFERSNQDERDSALLLVHYLFEQKPKKSEYEFF